MIWSFPLRLTDVTRNCPYTHSVKHNMQNLTFWTKCSYNWPHSILKGLRHCATRRKVAGPIPDCVIGIFHWHNPSGCTMVLGLTQPLTKMSTRNISWGWRRPVRRADNLTTFMCRLPWKSEILNLLEPSGPVQACNGVGLPLRLRQINRYVTSDFVFFDQ